MSGMVGKSLACPDWLDKLTAGRVPIVDLDLNDNRAERAAAIFGNLRLPDVHDQPYMRDGR